MTRPGTSADIEGMLRFIRLILPASLVGLGACTGTIGSDDGQGASSGVGGQAGATAVDLPSGGITSVEARGECLGKPLDPGPSAIRRLTRREYNNAVRDLLGDASEPASSWLAEPGEASFDNNAVVQVISRQHVEQFRGTALAIATRAVQQVGVLAPCADPAGAAASCGAAFIETFGRRAFRRPLTSQESATLLRVFALGQESGGYAHGIELVLQSILQAFQFLYLPELGVADAAPQLRLSGWELASRLSFFLWATTPDDQLLRAAESGELATDEGVLAHAERLLADPRAVPTIEHFYAQWLRVTGLPKAERSPSNFAGFSSSVAASMLAGTRAFASEVSLHGSFADLMTAGYSFVDGNTAAILGVSLAPGAPLQRVEAPAGERAGILTDLGVLTAHSGYDQHSPIARGVYIRDSVMCSPPPPPPPGAAFVAPATDPTLTTRERFEQHRREPACAACHAYFDVIGLGFENYDSIGRYRSAENGKPIDARGEVVAYDDDNRSFDGALEFAELLAGSNEARACFMTQWFRFASGRQEAGDDECTLVNLYAKFEERQFSIRGLLLELTRSPAFLYRRRVTAEECAP